LTNSLLGLKQQPLTRTKKDICDLFGANGEGIVKDCLNQHEQGKYTE